jgi:hypothetical protein
MVAAACRIAATPSLTMKVDHVPPDIDEETQGARARILTAGVSLGD